MRDFHAPQIYRGPCFDDVEDVEMYRPGGYHPIDLYDILGGRYSHGGFATIWLARDLLDNMYVAVKALMTNRPGNDVEFLSYIQDHGWNHPNIASLHDVLTIRGPNGQHQCLVFNFVGPSLKRMTDYAHRLPSVMAHNAAQQIAKGLAHLHSIGICHGGTASLMAFIDLMLTLL